MNKFDLILVSFLFIFFVILPLSIRQNANGLNESVYISVDGKVVQSLPLDSDTTYFLETEYGTNAIEVKSGQAFVSESDCDGKDCIKQGFVATNKHIICLPHHLDIYLKSDSSIDSLTY